MCPKENKRKGAPEPSGSDEELDPELELEYFELVREALGKTAKRKAGSPSAEPLEEVPAKRVTTPSVVALSPGSTVKLTRDVVVGGEDVFAGATGTVTAVDGEEVEVRLSKDLAEMYSVPIIRVPRAALKLTSSAGKPVTIPPEPTGEEAARLLAEHGSAHVNAILERAPLLGVALTRGAGKQDYPAIAEAQRLEWERRNPDAEWPAERYNAGGGIMGTSTYAALLYEWTFGGTPEQTLVVGNDRVEDGALVEGAMREIEELIAEMPLSDPKALRDWMERQFVSVQTGKRPPPAVERGRVAIPEEFDKRNRGYHAEDQKLYSTGWDAARDLGIEGISEIRQILRDDLDGMISDSEDSEQERIAQYAADATFLQLDMKPRILLVCSKYTCSDYGKLVSGGCEREVAARIDALMAEVRAELGVGFDHLSRVLTGAPPLEVEIAVAHTYGKRPMKQEDNPLLQSGAMLTLTMAVQFDRSGQWVAKWTPNSAKLAQQIHLADKVLKAVGAVPETDGEKPEADLADLSDAQTAYPVATFGEGAGWTAVPRDGDCLFHCLELAGLGNAAALRAQLSAEVRQHPLVRVVFLETAQREALAEEIGRDGNYAGLADQATDLAALVNGLSITIVHPDGSTSGAGNGARQITLGLASNHYWVLHDAGGNYVR